MSRLRSDFRLLRWLHIGGYTMLHTHVHYQCYETNATYFFRHMEISVWETTESRRSLFVLLDKLVKNVKRNYPILRIIGKFDSVDTVTVFFFPIHCSVLDDDYQQQILSNKPPVFWQLCLQVKASVSSAATRRSFGWWRSTASDNAPSKARLCHFGRYSRTLTHQPVHVFAPSRPDS